MLADMRSQKDNISQIVLAVEMTNKESIYGFHGNRKIPFLKITVALPRFNAAGRRLLERGFNFPGYPNHGYQAYESNIDFEIRYVIVYD